MRRVINIQHDATERLHTEVLPILTHQAHDLVTSGVRIFVTKCHRGRADFKTRIARIPAWVFDEHVNFAGRGIVRGGIPFAGYYLAHELAHIKAAVPTHNAQFMSAFKELCPTELQWYETLYKPRLAAAANIIGNKS